MTNKNKETMEGVCSFKTINPYFEPTTKLSFDPDFTFTIKKKVVERI